MSEAQKPLPLEVELLVLAELQKRIKARFEQTKAIVGQDYEPGDKRTFRAPDGRKLGSVYRTDPDPKWTVTDELALREHLRQDPSSIEKRMDITSHDDAVKVLLEHAPHLVAEVEVVRADAIADAVQRSREAGEPVAPGIDQVASPSTVAVRPDKDAGAAIEAMHRAGLLTWDGRLALPSEAES